MYNPSETIKHIEYFGKSIIQLIGVGTVAGIVIKLISVSYGWGKKVFEKKQIIKNLTVVGHIVNEPNIIGTSLQLTILPENYMSYSDIIINKKKRELMIKKLPLNLTSNHFPQIFNDERLHQLAKSIMFSHSPLKRSSFFNDINSEECLKQKEAEIREFYEDDDLYQLFEENSHHFNIIINNETIKYLEDVSINVEIPASNGLLIADRIHDKPEDDITGILPRSFLVKEKPKYPSVEKNINFYCIEAKLGNLEHIKSKSVFQIPIRIVLMPFIKNEPIEIKIKIFTKTLAYIIEKSLFIIPQI